MTSPIVCWRVSVLGRSLFRSTAAADLVLLPQGKCVLDLSVWSKRSFPGHRPLSDGRWVSSYFLGQRPGGNKKETGKRNLADGNTIDRCSDRVSYPARSLPSHGRLQSLVRLWPLAMRERSARHAICAADGQAHIVPLGRISREAARIGTKRTFRSLSLSWSLSDGCQGDRVDRNLGHVRHASS